MSSLNNENGFETINIKLVGNSAFLDVPGHGAGERSSKVLKVDTLCNAFRDKDDGIQTPFLPVNTLKYKEKGNNCILYLHSKEAKFTATVGDKKYEDCIRPSLVMIIFLSKQGGVYNIHDSKCFAVKDDRMLITDSTVLYGMPFPNISCDGWICWGANSTGGNFQSLTGLGMLVDRLFNSPFNNHVFSSSAFRHLEIGSHHDFFKYIQNKERFPEELLLRTVDRVTLGSI